MGDGAQEIAAHFFLLGFGAELFLLLDLGGQRADHDGDGQHDEERQGVAGDGEVQLHVGVGKDPVDADDAEERGKQAEQIPVGKAGDEDDRALKDQGDEDVGRVDHPQQRAEDGRQAEKADARHENGNSCRSRARRVFGSFLVCVFPIRSSPILS